MSDKRKRSPRGVSHSPIALRLMPTEREDADLLSKDMGISKSSMARQAYLLGLPLLKQQSVANQA